MTFVQIVGHITPITCVLVAAILAYKKTEGWGWFLFIALMVA